MRDKVGVLDSYHLGIVMEKSARKLGERCGVAAVKMLSRRLTEYIGTHEEDIYSYIWRSAIEDHEQNAHIDDCRTVLVEAVRESALGAVTTDPDNARATVTMLLESPFATLVRVGIYVCGEHYGSMGKSFWDCAKQNWFVDIVFWHEIYWFIKKAFPRFSPAEKTKFLEFVSLAMGEWSDESLLEELDECHRRDLLHPAFGKGDSNLDAQYQALVQKWGPVRDYPDFHTYTTSGGWVGDRSPVSSDELVEMSNENLVNFLVSFKPDSRAFDGPTYRGVSSALAAAVKASEDGFASRIDLFKELARPYQHGLLRGLKERWSDDKREINWVKTISFIQSIVVSSSFKTELEADQSVGWDPSIHCIINDIADLIKAACGTERTIPAEYQKQCFGILKSILSDIAPATIDQADDAVFKVINSPRGRAIEAFIHLVLAMRRKEVASTSTSNATWAECAPVFEAELSKSELGLNADFSALAGMYCVNLHFLNSQWTEDNFDRLFSLSNEAAWRYAAQGFGYQRYLYDWLFRSLINGGHLRRMIYSENLPDRVCEKALQFLGLAYLESMESLEDGGLLCELISSLKVKELSKLCWFFWTFRKKGEASPRGPKILTFWIKVAVQIRSNQAELPQLQSALNQLAVFIDAFTPNLVEAWEAAAPYAQIRHHGNVLVENLARLSIQYPKESATIFRAAITGFLPNYPKEDVIRYVNNLAEAGEFEEAEWVCNAYAEQGSTLLKETYEAIRNRQRSQIDMSIEKE